MAKSNTPITATSKKRSKLAIDRPFDPAILKRARTLAEQYQITVHFEDGDYYGRSVELPGVMNDGKTPAECIEKTIDIVTTALAVMLEDGHVPPAPASDEKRDEQVNVRLTKLEKALFEEAARSRGFRGISDFFRAAAIASTR